jgi:hypothetical protein
MQPECNLRHRLSCMRSTSWNGGVETTFSGDVGISFAFQPSTIKNWDQFTLMCAKEKPIFLQIGRHTSDIFRKCIRVSVAGAPQCIPELSTEPRTLPKTQGVGHVAWPGSREESELSAVSMAPRVNPLVTLRSFLSGTCCAGWAWVCMATWVNVWRRSRPVVVIERKD